MGVNIPNPRGHKTAWGFVFPNEGATPKDALRYLHISRATRKCGSLHPQLEGPHQRVGVRIPKLRGHAEA